MKKQKHEHENKCECAICKNGMEATLLKEASKLEKFGWIIHYVLNEGISDFHTHGLEENFNHIDLQIYFPSAPKTAQGILNVVVDRIKAGEKFESGNEYEDLLIGYKVLFRCAKESDRTVLRLILPNVDGKYDSAPVYKAQFDGLVELF